MTAGRFRRVLVGWDGSAGAAEALDAAASIADDGGHVVALAVLSPAFGVEAEADDRSERTTISALAQEHLERAREASPRGVRMSLQIVENGQAGQAICDYAAEHGFDLLVVGRHGDGGVLHPRLGRVAGAAVRGCAVPVLLL